ncbi:MAG: hypothetical protein Q8J63_03565 [Candidatus Aquicultor sp.]|nr:hypothetical protein [Candidatus Aquicultor sp.]
MRKLAPRLSPSRPSRAKYIAIAAVALMIAAFFIGYAQDSYAYKTDGLLVYGVGAENTPKHRLWDHGLSSWGNQTDSAAASATINWVINETAKNRKENISGILTTNGGGGSNLHIRRWNGSSWASEWNTTSANANFAGRRSFDIAYEESSGNALVVYSTGTNPQFRVWNGSTWTDATNVLGAAEAGNIEWIELASRPNSDEIALLYAINDGVDGHTLKGIIWDGSSWGTQSAALETNLAFAVAGGDTKSFDATYENSGELIVVFGWNSLVNNSLAARYVRKAAGAAWGAATNFVTWADEATVVNLAAEPGGDRIVAVTADSKIQDMQYAIWDGGAWVNRTANADSTMYNLPNWAGTMPVAAGWAVVGASAVAIVAYADNADNDIHWRRWTSAGWTSPADWNPGHTIGYLRSIDIDRQPGEDKLLVAIGDTNNDLWAKTCDGTNWANTNDNPSLQSNLSSSFLPFDFIFDRYALTIINDGGNPSNKTVVASATNIGIDSFTLAVNTGIDTVTSITFTGNSSFDSSKVQNIRIYRDNGGTPNEWDAGDSLISTGVLSGTQVDFTGLNIAVDKTAKQYLVVFDLAPTATDSVLTGIVTAAVAANTLQLSDIGSASVTINVSPPGQVSSFVAAEGEDRQSTLSWINPLDEDFHGIRILRRGDGLYPTGPTDPLATIVWEDLTPPIATTYTDLGPLINGNTYHYACFTHDTSNNWHTAVIPGLNADTAIPGTSVTVTNAAVATGDIYQGQTDIVTQRLDLSTTFSEVTLDSIKVGRTGTGADSDISSVRIYTDLNHNGAIDAEDTQLGSNTFSSGSATIAFAAQTIGTTASSFLVVYNISATSNTSVTLGSNIADKTYLNITGASQVYNFSNHGSNTLTLNGDVVTMTSAPVDTIAYRGKQNVVMQKLGVSTNYSSALLTAIEVTKDGTLADSKIDAVKIFLDTNEDGLFGAGDTQLGSGAFSGGTLNITLSSAQTITTSSKTYFILYDIAASASAGATVGSTIVSQSSITVSAPDSVAGFTNLSSNLITLTSLPDTLYVSHAVPANIDADQGTQNNVLDVLKFAAKSGDGGKITGIRLDQVGSALASDITSINLFRDTNGNSSFDAASDQELSSATLVNGSANFSFSLDIAQNTTETVFVVARVSGLATIGSTIHLNMANQNSVTINAPDIIEPFTALSSATLTILDKPDTLNINQIAAGGGNITLGTSDNVIQILDLSVDEDYVNITRLDINRIGTALDSDTQPGGIKLWHDADKNGTKSRVDWQLSAGATFVDGSVRFDDIKEIKVTSANSLRFLVTASTKLDAIIDRTIGASIENTGSAAVSSPDIVSLSSTPLSSLLSTLTPRSPSAPTGLNVQANHNRQLTLDWNVNNASEHITEYKVFRAASGGDYVFIDDTATSSFIDTVPLKGAYSYKISAVNTTGESVKSAPAQAESVDIQLTLPSTGNTTTVESADGSIEIAIPPDYANKQFSVKTEAKPAGLSIVSEYYYTFTLDAAPPFDPPLTITLRCANDVTEGTKIYHYTSAGTWVEVTGGNYTRSGNLISYDGITEFSGYVATDMTSIGGYNYPIINTDTPSGPHGQYTSASNRCKDCHAGHRALGMYRLTRADIRGDACNFCHGISGAAAKTVILDANGHGISDDEIGKPVIAPDDTDPAYIVSSTMWGCLECHSVHDNQSITPAGYSSNKLLKSDPNPGKSYLYYTPVVGESTQTLSQWCSTCHNTNFGASSDIENKIVPMGALTGRAASHASSGAGTTTNTAGKVIVNSYDGTNNGPTCRECHPSDGGNPAVAARFPHTSGSTRAMLKAGSSPIQIDNICVGCHQTASLN